MPDNFTSACRDLVGCQIDNGCLELVSILGVGAYGVVYLGVDVRMRAANPLNHNAYVAIKCLSRVGLDARQRHFQRREIALHQLATGHPHIAAVHKVIEEERHIFVVMDYCAGGDLFTMIIERQRYLGDDDLVRSVFLQIVDAVAYCHSMGIFHRDLKPENILCSADGLHVSLADFGLATTERMSTDFGCGSTFYLSPECQGGVFKAVDVYSTEQADLWSLGVILVNLACGRNPWRQACAEDDTFRAYLEDPTLLSTILPLSPAATSILAGLFARDPADRISLAQLRAMVVAAPSFSTINSQLPSPAPSPPHVTRASQCGVPAHTSAPVQYDNSWDSTDFAEFTVSPLSSAPPSPFATYVTLNQPQFVSPNRTTDTPVSTPGLISSSVDPFYAGRCVSNASSIEGELPPTPELAPTHPERWPHHFALHTKGRRTAQPVRLLSHPHTPSPREGHAAPLIFS